MFSNWDLFARVSPFFILTDYYYMGTNQKKKTKFRESAKWKKFRAFMKKQCNGTDFVTGKKLIKGFQLHHKDMRVENYEKLSPERFLCCNRKTHDLIHFCFNYYKNDPGFIDRLKQILDEMVNYNSD